MTGDDRARGYVVHDQRPGTNQGAGADVDAAHDDRPASDGRTLSHNRAFHFPIAFSLRCPIGRCRPWVTVVDKDHAMTDKHFVLDRDARANKRMTRYFAAPTDFRVALNLYKCTEPGIIADQAAVEIHKRREPHALAQADVVGDAAKLGRGPFVIGHTHRSALPSGTIRPPLRSDQFAASSTLTTRKPLTPSVFGVVPLRMHLTKCAHSLPSGSFSSMRG